MIIGGTSEDSASHGEYADLGVPTVAVHLEGSYRHHGPPGAHYPPTTSVRSDSVGSGFQTPRLG